MCEKCSPWATHPELPSIESLLEEHSNRLESLFELHAELGKLPERDRTFAESLVSQFAQHHALSASQWHWVEQLSARITGAVELAGDFRGVFVMFRLANTTGDMLRPKVRLMTPDGIFVQLNFEPEKPNEIRVFRDGWSGHGRRRYAGTIYEGRILPYGDRFTPSMIAVIQQFATDPLATALAMAKLLNACMYCGSRLADEESKSRGYGPTCAGNWHLPWGSRTNAPPTREVLDFMAELDRSLS